MILIAIVYGACILFWIVYNESSKPITEGYKMLKTDFDLTGKLYTKLDSYVLCDTPSQLMPESGVYYYFGSSIMFKTCKNFKQFLENKHKHNKFKVNIA